MEKCRLMLLPPLSPSLTCWTFWIIFSLVHQMQNMLRLLRLSSSVSSRLILALNQLPMCQVLSNRCCHQGLNWGKRIWFHATLGIECLSFLNVAVGGLTLEMNWVQILSQKLLSHAPQKILVHIDHQTKSNWLQQSEILNRVSFICYFNFVCLSPVNSVARLKPRKGVGTKSWSPFFRKANIFFSYQAPIQFDSILFVGEKGLMAAQSSSPLKRSTRYVSIVVKYNKKSFRYLTAFFMPTC